MEKIVIRVGEKPLTLLFNSFKDEIDIDELTKIEYSNLYGEAVTISALLSKIGIMRAEAEKHQNQVKLVHEIFEANLKKKHRSFAAQNGGKISLQNGELLKLTENSLDEIIKVDISWQRTKEDYIEAKRQYEYIDAIFWAVNSKDKKLNNLIKGITPEELYEELVEGVINGIAIKKTKISYQNNEA